MVLAGQILGKAAVYDGKNAVQTQSYGAEARGTVAKSEVIISKNRIGFPAVRKCDILIAMSQEALDKNLKDLKENGLLLIDNSLVKNVPQVKAKVYEIPATALSEKTFGQKTYANMIMLGALTKIIKLVSQDSMEKAVKDSFAEKAADANLQAYKKGTELIA
ncbi:MAG: 2-oxoacid:acceptor oxidoreductase family protein [Candidatus Bathyarchaeales archaeon]